VNNSSLDGTVTGATVSYSTGDYADHNKFIAKNTLENAFNGSAGINQSVQNTASNALAQQQVSFQGNVNVNQ